jgi:hypothetical protein
MNSKGLAAGWRFLWSLATLVALLRCTPSDFIETGTDTVALQAGASGGDLCWLRRVGEHGSDQALSVAWDRDGHVIALFQYQGRVDVGGALVGSGDFRNVGFAVVKYTAGGTLLWARHFEGLASPDGGASVLVQALAVDRERAILVSGTSFAPIDLGAGVRPPGGFLLKLRKDGRLLWARHFEGESVVPRHLVTDSGNAIALAGVFSGTVDFGQGPVSAPLGRPSAFLTKFSSSGAPLWTFAEVTEESAGIGVAVDEEDALYMAGRRFPDPVLWKLSPGGALVWTRSLENAVGGALDVAVHGNRVVMVGQFNNAFPFRGRSVEPPPTGNGGFVVAWTRAGEERWGRSLGGTVSAVAMGEDDSVVVGGNYTAGNDLGNGPAPGLSGFNLFLARLERIQGTQQWVRTFPADSSARVTELSVTKQGTFAASGFFRGTVDFGVRPLTSRGEEDAFLLSASLAGGTGPCGQPALGAP